MKPNFIPVTAIILTLSATPSAMTSANAFADTPQANATSYAYLPGASIVMGQGFSIESPTASTAPCIEKPQVFTNINRNINQDGAVDVSVVSSNTALKVVLGIDTEMDASSLLYSGKGSMDFNSEVDISENDATVVIHGSASYSNDLLDQSQLKYTPDAQSLLDARDFEGFRKLCGQQLITSVDYGTDLAIVISMKGLSDQEKVSFNTSMSGSGGFGPISGSAKTTLDSLLNRSSQNTSIRMQAFVRGGNGLPDFDQLINQIMSSGTSVEQLTSGVTALFQRLTPAAAAVTGFTTQPYPGVDPTDSNLLNILKTDHLESLATEFRRMNACFVRLQEDFSRQQDQISTVPDFENVASSILQNAQAEMPVLEQYLNALASAHEACLVSTAQDLGTVCASPKMPIIPDIKVLYWEISQI